MTGTALELRVHGVSNTPPESLLGPYPPATCPPPHPPRLCRVAGDETTGFYRRPDRPDLEAYSWGQLTSGARDLGVRARKDIQRALWTLLLPFALANLAMHARGRVDQSAGWSAFLVRLFGLSLTVTLVAAATLVGVDLIAWQCVDEACLAQLPGSWGFLAEGYWHAAGPATAVGLAVPVALLLVIALAARLSHRYEAVLPADQAGGTAAGQPQGGGPANPLQDPNFWRGEHQVRGLSNIHLATGLAVAAAIPFTVFVVKAPPHGGPAWIAWVAGVLLAGTILLSVAGLLHPAITARGYAGNRSLLPWLPLLGLAGLAGTVWFLLWIGKRDPTALDDLRPTPGCIGMPAGDECYEDLSLPLQGELLTWLALGQLTLLLLLALTGLRHRRRPRTDRYARLAWWGMGPAVFAGFGWALGIAYASGIVYWVSGRLHPGATPTGWSIITLPTPLLWTGLAVSLLVLSVAAAGFVVFCYYHRLRRRALRNIETDRSRELGSRHAQRRAHRAASWGGLHYLVERCALRTVGWLAAVVALLAVAGVAASLAGILPQDSGPGRTLRRFLCPWETGAECRPPHDPDRWWEYVIKFMSDAGGWLAGVVPLLVVGLALLTYHLAGVRRGVGVIWDIGSFWPRSAHPLAPPSYAERAVPELQTRTHQLLADGTVSGIIFSGHSQGALLCLATILQLPASLHRRSWLVTHGCQLSRLYGRVFPAYLSPRQLAAISQQLRRDGAGWTNFWRPTDPLGFRIQADGDKVAPDPQIEVVEHRLTDPEQFCPTGGEVVSPPIRNHSDYPYDKVYQRECRTVRNRLARVR